MPLSILFLIGILHITRIGPIFMFPEVMFLFNLSIRLSILGDELD